MEDREIVAALAAGDPAGIAAAYDTYAGPVYGYCRWMLREPAEAAEAARDTFVIAAGGVPADPGFLRSWFFATARGECLRRPSLVRGEPVEAAVLEGAGGAAGAGADKREAERAELRALIPATLARLGPEQREAVVLSLWHDLDDADLAAVFGVSRPEAYTMASGGRGQLEKALGTLRLARTGRAACPELATVLADWDGRLTMDTLHRAGRHVEQCQTCAAAKRGKLRPEALARLLPLAALPAGLREQVLELCASPAPEAVAYREQVRERAGRLPRARWSKARRHPRVAAAVAVVAVAVAVGVPVMAAGSVHGIRPLVPQASAGAFSGASAPVPAGGGASVGTGTSRSPSPSSQPTAAARLTPSVWSPPEPSPSLSARPSRSPSAKPSPSPSPSSSPSGSPSPSPSSSPTPTPTRTRSPSPSPSPSTIPSTDSPSPSASATSS